MPVWPFIEILAYIGAGIWLIILVLPWRPWSTRECLEVSADPSLDSSAASELSSITVLTPARNEEETIETTVHSVLAHDSNLTMIVVNDQSTDSTAQKLQSLKSHYGSRLLVVDGTEVPVAWSGKMWALEQGFQSVQTPYTLLLDADIQLRPGFIHTLYRHAQTQSSDLTSIMASLRMKTLWEKMLIPSFIYFFKLLYPFHLGNSSRSKRGVAAGGCILIKTDTLQSIGGFAALKGALIDDCTLAQLVKSKGYRTWIGLSLSVTSHRGYDDLKGIWNMVARSAFTQLRYSFLALAACSLTMLAMFVAPLLYLWHHGHNAFVGAGLIAMGITYAPTLRFYHRSFLWLASLPLIGSLYLAMTWTSAFRYLTGQRSQWKDRVYLKDALKDKAAA